MKIQSTKDAICNQIRRISIIIYIGCITLLIDQMFGNYILGHIGIWLVYIIGFSWLSDIIASNIKILSKGYYTIWGGLKSLMISIIIAFLLLKGIKRRGVTTQNK